MRGILKFRTKSSPWVCKYLSQIISELKGTNCFFCALFPISLTYPLSCSLIEVNVTAATLCVVFPIFPCESHISFLNVSIFYQSCANEAPDFSCWCFWSCMLGIFKVCDYGLLFFYFPSQFFFVTFLGGNFGWANSTILHWVTVGWLSRAPSPLLPSSWLDWVKSHFMQCGSTRVG